MKYLLIWAVFLVLFYIFLRWVIRRTPVTEDDDPESAAYLPAFWNALMKSGTQIENNKGAV